MWDDFLLILSTKLFSSANTKRKILIFNSSKEYNHSVWSGFDSYYKNDNNEKIISCPSCQQKAMVSNKELDFIIASKISIEIHKNPPTILILIAGDESYDGIIDTAERKGSIVKVVGYKEYNLIEQPIFEIGELLCYNEKFIPSISLPLSPFLSLSLHMEYNSVRDYTHLLNFSSKQCTLSSNTTYI